MPSTQPLPTISSLLTAAGNAVRGQNDEYADTRRGSIHDHASGPMAILFSREASRDVDLFADTYLHDATGDALTNLIEGRYGIARVLSTAGMGTVTFTRSSASAGAGTLLAGTRISAGSPPAIYSIATNTPVSSTQVVIQNVPIVASETGTGTAISAVSGLTLLDPLYDPLWQPQSLVCEDGTDFEQANDYRSRASQIRLNARNGYLARLVQVCQAAGAIYVVAFASQYGLDSSDFDDDYGLNAIYVSDANFQSTAALIQACALALESVRVGGADLYIGGIQQQNLYVQALVNLVDDPGRLDLLPIQQACVQALLAYFSPTSSGYTFKRDALTGAIKNAHPSVQQIADGGWVSPSSDVTLAPTNWPATLTRYVLTARYINLSFAGPV
jgi:hypothetical protein